MIEVQRHEGFDFDSISQKQVGLQTNERERYLTVLNLLVYEQNSATG